MFGVTLSLKYKCFQLILIKHRFQIPYKKRTIFIMQYRNRIFIYFCKLVQRHLTGKVFFLYKRRDDPELNQAQIKNSGTSLLVTYLHELQIFEWDVK